MVSETTDTGATDEATGVPFELDAEALYARLSAYAARLVANAAPHAPCYLVGIASGGAWLAERLSAEQATPYGIISSTLHRDDFAKRGLGGAGGQAVQTHLPFAVEGANILLIDDVLYTGRTIRAALNELYDYGRPAKVGLAVLVDRGGRELPIAADFAAHTFANSAPHAAQSLQLRLEGLATTGKLHFSLGSKE